MTNQSMAVIEPLKLSKILFDINLLREFPLSDIQIEDLTVKLKQLAPNLKSEDLMQILNKFAMNKIKWDNKQIIQNIFHGIEVHREDTRKEFEIRFRKHCETANKTLNINIDEYYENNPQDEDYTQWLTQENKI